MQIITKILFISTFFLISCGPSGAEQDCSKQYKSDSILVDSISKLNQVQSDSTTQLDSIKTNGVEIELGSTENNKIIIQEPQTKNIDSLYAAKKEAYKIIKMKNSEYKIKTLKNTVNSIDTKLDSISYYLKENKVKNEKQREHHNR